MSRLIGPGSRDPVTTYARHVDRGKILAGRLVRLACARHLRDLERQLTPDFPYRFDVKRADQVFIFFQQFLTLDDERPFELMPWSGFILGSLEGWVDRDGTQRFTTSYTETSKGSAKSPTAAGYGLFGLVGKDERGAEIYSLGVDAAQANYLYKFAKGMGERSPELSEVLEIGEHNISWPARTSYFRPLSAEGRSLDNKRPYLAIVDELHEHPSSVIPEKMRLGFKGRRNALLFEITNAGFDKTSVCWLHHEYSVQVLEGIVTGPAAERWFAYICQLDPCEACRSNGATQPNDGCPNCDDWTDPKVWLKVQPALGVTISKAQLQAIVDEAIDRPSVQARTKRLSFCMWTQAHTVWIQHDKWEACRVDQVAEANDGRPCTLGFDMSEKLDLTAGVIAMRVDDDIERPEDVVELLDVVEGQEVKKTLNLNFCVELIPFFWLPEETLLERVKNEHIPFDLWRQQVPRMFSLRIDAEGNALDRAWRHGPMLRVTPGPVIDHDLIYSQVMSDLVPAYRPQRIGYDPHNATQFAVQLRDKGRQRVVEVKQGRPLSETFKLFEALVRLRRIRHAGNPVLGWCVGNADPKRDRYENIWVEKPSPTKRIDGLIAAIIALNQLVALPAKRKSSGAMVL